MRIRCSLCGSNGPTMITTCDRCGTSFCSDCAITRDSHYCPDCEVVLEEFNDPMLTRKET